MEKSGIKHFLENWYILKASNNIEVMLYLLAVEQIIDDLCSKEQLTYDDLFLIDEYRVGYSLSEIARHMGVSPQAASKRLDKIAGLLLLELSL